MLTSLKVNIPKYHNSLSDSQCLSSFSNEDEYKDVVSLCREKIRRAKGQLEFNLATAIKGNKKRFL